MSEKVRDKIEKMVVFSSPRYYENIETEKSKSKRARCYYCGETITDENRCRFGYGSTVNPYHYLHIHCAPLFKQVVLEIQNARKMMSDSEYRDMLEEYNNFVHTEKLNGTIIYVDGGYNDGKGVSSAFFEEDQVVLAILRENATNNTAEYDAVILALLNVQGNNRVVIYNDSQLVVSQLNEEYRINKKHLAKRAKFIWRMAEEKNLRVHYVHISSLENKAHLGKWPNIPNKLQVFGTKALRSSLNDYFQ